MKIIYQSYNCCSQNASGGVQNRLRKIESLVSERGLKTELFNPFTTKLEKEDILHVFMLNLDNYNLIQYAKKHGVKIVISTIVPLIDTFKLRLYKSINKLPIVTTYKLNQSTLSVADALITESHREATFISNYYQIADNKFYIIPNGVECNSYYGQEIYDLLGTRKKYVLQVGRFDKNKNQLNVIRALKGTNIDVVFVGGPGDVAYFNQCKREAEGYNNIHIVGWLKNDSLELQSAYSNAEVVVLPSFFETFGLVAIEGASYGAKLVLSKTLPINEYDVFAKCHKLDPKDVSDIKMQIMAAFYAEKDDDFQENVNSFFKWDTIVDKHLEIYDRI